MLSEPSQIQKDKDGSLRRTTYLSGELTETESCQDILSLVSWKGDRILNE